MLEVSSNKFGRWRRVDISDLWLTDGRNANSLNAWQLYDELAKVGCPNIARGMAKPDLLFALGVFQQDQREAAR
jgi:hypothetical protein